MKQPISQALAALALAIAANGAMTQLAGAWITRCPSGTIEMGLSYFWVTSMEGSLCFGTRYCKSVYAYGGNTSFTAEVPKSRCLAQ